jgi:hypothetical protein
MALTLREIVEVGRNELRSPTGFRSAVAATANTLNLVLVANNDMWESSACRNWRFALFRPTKTGQIISKVSAISRKAPGSTAGSITSVASDSLAYSLARRACIAAHSHVPTPLKSHIGGSAVKIKRSNLSLSSPQMLSQYKSNARTTRLRLVDPSIQTMQLHPVCQTGAGYRSAQFVVMMLILKATQASHQRCPIRVSFNEFSVF